MSDEISHLREALLALTERVAVLEQRRHVSHSAPLDEGGFWALNGLQARLHDDASTTEGAVMLVGALTLPTGAPVSWQQTVGTAGQLEATWAERASVFAALGHPVRLELLRHIVSGTHATSELAAVEGLGTTGQLHHHLRQLVSAGWVRQSGRGSYEVPAARIVPLLVCVLGAER
ncbi:helix-turn-helix transcriptional regulator [Microbacterium sp. UCD-TDU]|uniref:ArsR/SmtB family transcription factor n=1 Tax=Microbacterium sp. UCD-TDU TaxID=1247714 RepID=UPI000437A8FC|nr:helix-turn-helix domain-containing protein [Microbacterium sp. UCD-TDU]EYT59369.1 ArsR family transcriptional regulator [Microbacterium sp. UCD-TDU]